MNLNNLYPIQKELDKYIGESKSINMEEFKLERVLALQVEFGELLNELPFLFKYWSNKKMNREKALVEYIDGLHFILSIGNDLGIENYEYKQPEEHDMKRLAFGINNMISMLPEIRNNKTLYTVLTHDYILFGKKLGFTEEQVVETYLEKNRINHERQNNDY